MKKYITLAAFAAISTTLIFIFAQGGKGPDPDRESPMLRYLGMNCGDDKVEKQLLTDLRAQAVEAEAFFKRIVENGPNERMIATEREAAQKQYGGRREFVQSKNRRITGIPDSLMASTQNETEAAFIERRLASQRTRFIYRSMEGLKLLDTPSAKEFLTLKAKDKQFELQQEAAELIGLVPVRK